MGAPDFLSGVPKSVDDRFRSVSVPSGSVETTVVSVNTRVGVRAFICFLASNTQGPPSDITWNLKASGAKQFPYSDFSVQVAEISRPSDYLPFPVEVAQNSTVEITAKNAGVAAVVCSARVQIFYLDF